MTGRGQAIRVPPPLIRWNVSAAMCWPSRDLTSRKVHWCGLSDGGMVGQWLAPRPDRFDRIFLQHRLPLSDRPLLNRIRREGRRHRSWADAVIANWLTADFREREPQ